MMKRDKDGRMNHLKNKVRVVDSHTEGEPTRLVIDGIPSLGSGSIREKLRVFRDHHDEWRRALIHEPRGHDVLVGALLCEPSRKGVTCGVIFFNNKGYLGMCGHGTIGLIASLKYMKLIDAGEHVIETPVGDVSTVLHDDGSVSVRNIRSWRYRKSVPVDVPEYGVVCGDIAWGGNWFFLVDINPERISADNIDTLKIKAEAIMSSLKKQQITGEKGALIDHVEFFSDSDNADSRNFVLCPGHEYDRSPCGTGTSAKLACLAADEALSPGEIWIQESVIGSRFRASYEHAPHGGVIPTIKGRAWVYADSTIILNDDDPFCWGIAK
ncbi:MAG: proline racemase family protein [Lautropia sp.]|nr:proline racemase family protein [Lautropia sp.]